MNENIEVDAQRVIDRRNALRLIAGASATVFAACSSKAKTAVASASSSASGASSSSAANADTSSVGTDGSCTVVPGETAGPYPGDGTNGPNILAEDGVVRSDMTKSLGTGTAATGIPLSIALTVLDSSGCKVMPDAAVYVWHADRTGSYSMYSDGIEDENYLRAVQPTNSSGTATFESIFAGCYASRWPHIHFEVFASVADAVKGTNRLSTSQIALPAAPCDLVYAVDSYSTSAANFSGQSIDQDMVFGDDGGIHQLGTVTGSVADGFRVALTIAV